MEGFACSKNDTRRKKGRYEEVKRRARFMRLCENPECNKKYAPMTLKQKYCCPKCNNRHKYLKKLEELGKGRCNSCYETFQITKKEQVRCKACRNRDSDRQKTKGYRDKETIHPLVSIRNRFLLRPLI